MDWDAYGPVAARAVGYVLGADPGVPLPIRVVSRALGVATAPMQEVVAMLCEMYPGLFCMTMTTPVATARAFWWRKVEGTLVATNVNWWTRVGTLEVPSSFASFWEGRSGILGPAPVWHSRADSGPWYVPAPVGVSPGALEMELARIVPRVLANAPQVPGVERTFVPVEGFVPGSVADLPGDVQLMRTSGPLRLAPNYRPAYPQEGIDAYANAPVSVAYCWRCGYDALRRAVAQPVSVVLKLTGSHASLWNLRCGRTVGGVTLHGTDLSVWCSQGRFVSALLEGDRCDGACGFPRLFETRPSSWTNSEDRRRWVQALAVLGEDVTVWNSATGARPASTIVSEYGSDSPVVSRPGLADRSGGAPVGNDDGPLRASFHSLVGATLEEEMASPSFLARYPCVLEAADPAAALWQRIVHPRSEDAIPELSVDAYVWRRLPGLASRLSVDSLDVILSDSTFCDILKLAVGAERVADSQHGKTHLWWAMTPGTAEGRVRVVVGLMWPGVDLVKRLPATVTLLSREQPGGGPLYVAGPDSGMAKYRSDPEWPVDQPSAFSVAMPQNRFDLSSIKGTVQGGKQGAHYPAAVQLDVLTYMLRHNPEPPRAPWSAVWLMDGWNRTSSDSYVSYQAAVVILIAALSLPRSAARKALDGRIQWLDAVLDVPARWTWYWSRVTKNRKKDLDALTVAAQVASALLTDGPGAALEVEEASTVLLREAGPDQCILGDGFVWAKQGNDFSIGIFSDLLNVAALPAARYVMESCWGDPAVDRSVVLPSHSRSYGGGRFGLTLCRALWELLPADARDMDCFEDVPAGYFPFDASGRRYAELNELLPEPLKVCGRRLASFHPVVTPVGWLSGTPVDWWILWSPFLDTWASLAHWDRAAKDAETVERGPVVTALKILLLGRDCPADAREGLLMGPRYREPADGLSMANAGKRHLAIGCSAGLRMNDMHPEAVPPPQYKQPSPSVLRCTENFAICGAMGCVPFLLDSYSQQDWELVVWFVACCPIVRADCLVVMQAGCVPPQTGLPPPDFVDAVVMAVDQWMPDLMVFDGVPWADVAFRASAACGSWTELPAGSLVCVWNGRHSPRYVVKTSQRRDEWYLELHPTKATGGTTRGGAPRAGRYPKKQRTGRVFERSALPPDMPQQSRLTDVRAGWGPGPESGDVVAGPGEAPWGSHERLYYYGRESSDGCYWPGFLAGWYAIVTGRLAGYHVLYLPSRGIIRADRPLPGYTAFEWQKHRLWQ